MKGIKIFENPTFGEIRIVLNGNQELLFCVTDACKVLAYTNSRKVVPDHVEDDVTKRYTISSMGREQQVTYVNESGLSFLVFGGKMDGIPTKESYLVSIGIKRQGVRASFLVKEGEELFTNVIKEKGGLK